jgi:predicted transcriptional regulator
VGIDMLIDKPRCNFKNCRFYFDGNCRSADIYENCKVTDLHSEIAKLRVDLDNAKAEVERLEHLRAELSKEVADLQDALKCEKETNAHLCGEYISAKAEVAREIFAEIEKISKAPYGYICLSNDELAELKKKYTEEKS